jgi:flagellar M-ring protein FliF
LLLDKDKYPTASVFVHVRGNSQLQPQTINSIRFLVANAVEGLKPNHVTVVDNLGNVLSENSDNDSLTGLTSTQLAARRNLEQYLARKAQDMLEKVLGPGQAIVRVSAEINYDTVSKVEEKFDPDGQVVKTQTKNDEETDSTTSSPSVPAGIAANAAASTSSDTNAATQAPSTPAPPVTNSKNRKTVANLQYEIGRTTSNIMQAAGGVKRLSAAVTVAAHVEGTGAERKVVNRTPDELDKLRRMVTSAVGIQSGTENTRGDTISLEELPFNEQFATEVSKGLEQQQKHDFWWNLARGAIYPAMGVVALFILLRLFKKTPIQEIPAAIPAGRFATAQRAYAGHANGNGNGHGSATDWRKEADPGVVTVEVLNRLLKENPANLTQAIREWMNKGRASES